MAIDVEARRVEVGKPGVQIESKRGMGGQIAEELGDAVVVEAVERAPEHVVVEVLRQNPLAEQPLGRLGQRRTGA